MEQKKSTILIGKEAAKFNPKKYIFGWDFAISVLTYRAAKR